MLKFVIMALSISAGLVASTVCARPANFDKTLIDGRPNPSVIGAWRSRGYGYVLDISATKIDVYNTAGDLCWKDNGVTESFSLAMPYVRPGATHIAFTAAAGETAILLDRLVEMPDACEQPVDATPVLVFDAFWQTMQENYPFFELHNVDWNARYEAGKKAVSHSQGERALFDIMSQSLAGLNDPHLSLSGEVDGERNHKNFSRPKTFEYLRTALDARSKGSARAMKPSEFYRAWVDADNRDIWQALHGPRGQAFDGRMMWGQLEAGIGYIGLTSLGGFTTTESVEADVTAMAAQLDSALYALRNTRGIIIDVSQNLGGTDAVALLIASRFADRRRLAFVKWAQGVMNEPVGETYVEPAGPDCYLKPTVILSSDVTMSAAEVLVLAMRNFPQVTHAGQTTRGGFSDVLVKTLPNGWTLGLSNEIYKTPNGNLLEGVGLVPDVPLDVFPAQRIWRNRLTTVRKVAATLPQPSLTDSEQRACQFR